MPNSDEYRAERYGPWRLYYLPTHWRDSLRERVLALAQEQSISRHPQTLPIKTSAGASIDFYLKVFHRSGALKAFKDLFRGSSAKRFWKQCCALSVLELPAPTVVAVGEMRRWGKVERGFVVSLPEPGMALPRFLQEQGGGLSLAQKRRALTSAGTLVRRFHDQGFIHGDLVSTNIYCRRNDLGDVEFCFMDHDRTQRGPKFLIGQRQRRNLVQLNRMPLARITLQDRMRFLRAYLGQERLQDSGGELARWLETRTRRRRAEVDGADPNQNFRRLMRFRVSP